jgi:plasmid replication initiation protein
MALTDILDKDVKKHVAAIHTDAKLSLLQRKLANVLLLNAYPRLLSQESHRIRVKELAEVAGFDSNDRQCLRDALLGLMKTVFRWNVIKKKGVEHDWDACVMICSASMRGAWCRYAYSPELRAKLYQPQIYAQINMSIQRSFTSSYALALYENCLSYRGAGQTPWWSVKEIRQILGLGDSAFYREYRDLNRKVLKPAIAQVNASAARQGSAKQ